MKQTKEEKVFDLKKKIEEYKKTEAYEESKEKKRREARRTHFNWNMRPSSMDSAKIDALRKIAEQLARIGDILELE